MPSLWKAKTWPSQGRAKMSDITGTPFLLHAASATVARFGSGHAGEAVHVQQLLRQTSFIIRVLLFCLLPGDMLLDFHICVFFVSLAHLSRCKYQPDVPLSPTKHDMSALFVFMLLLFGLPATSSFSCRRREDGYREDPLRPATSLHPSRTYGT